MISIPYYLGAPLWAVNEWKGEFYTKKAKPAEYLQQYAQFFNAVEGNTTFYATPSEAMVERWLASTPETFRFSFKFPRVITHEYKLQGVSTETTAFLERMQPLGQRLNGFMIQLSSSFSPAMLGALEDFIKSLPPTYKYAVEVRHPAFFTDAAIRQHYNELLQSLNVDRIIFDSRPVHSAPVLDEATKEAQRKKPRLPVQLDTTAQAPMLRYIGHPMLEENKKFLEPWVAQTARWLEAGMKPYIYLHTPSNVQVPLLAQQFHALLQQRVAGLPDLPAFPYEQNAGLL